MQGLDQVSGAPGRKAPMSFFGLLNYLRKNCPDIHHQIRGEQHCNRCVADEFFRTVPRIATLRLARPDPSGCQASNRENRALDFS